MSHFLCSLRTSAAVLAVAAASLTAFNACTHSGPATAEKPKYIWMCGEANFERFASKDSITHYLELARQTGFNNVVVDVKPIEGEVLYKSKLVPELTRIGDVEVVRDWDYLRYVIDEAHRLGMKVTASGCIFPAGNSALQQGLVYDDTTFNGLTCIEYLPDGSMIDIRDDRAIGSAFLNPLRPEAREFALGFIKEIVSNYDIDGFSLDYCRFPEWASDFSDYSREVFENRIGHKVGNFPADIFTYGEDGIVVPGPLFNDWMAFRAETVRDIVRDIRDTVKAINPAIDLNYWAASWIHAIQKNGQNWASPRSEWCKQYDYGTEAYRQAGFAPCLDNFIVGAYLERVYGPDDNESVEYALNRADSLIMGDCHVIGSIQSINHSADPADPHCLTNAVRCCLEKSEGLMVFDIVHIINHDQWAQIKAGIDQYESSQNAKKQKP